MFVVCFLPIIDNRLFPCASNTQGREEGEVEVKDGPGHEVSGPIGESLSPLLIAVTGHVRWRCKKMKNKYYYMIQYYIIIVFCE